jgi:hypothetical protein
LRIPAVYELHRIRQVAMSGPKQHVIMIRHHDPNKIPHSSEPPKAFIFSIHFMLTADASSTPNSTGESPRITSLSTLRTVLY